jgi:hypothetical protein
VDQLLDILRRVGKRLWSPVVDLWDDLRPARSRPLDPSTPSPTVDESDQATVVVTALVITNEQAARCGAALIATKLPEGFELLSQSTTATVSDPQIDGGTLAMMLEAIGPVAELFDETAVSEAVSGKSPADAAIELQQMLALEDKPAITLRPLFIPWRWLPHKADRISVTLAGPASLLEDKTDGETSEDGAATTVTATASP